MTTNRQYQIKVGGQLGPEWSEWFDGLAVIDQTNGETLLQGPLVDEAALYGLLGKVRDLGLPLLGISVLSGKPPAQNNEEVVNNVIRDQ